MSDVPVTLNQLKDVDNPKSVINLATDSLAKAIQFLPDSIFELSEKELKKQGNIGEVEDKLRICFWREYDHAHSIGKRINMRAIFSGNCSDVYFYKNILTNPLKLAYILTAPADYLTQIEDIWQLGIRRMRQILETEPIDDKGFIDPKLAEVQRKITEDAHLRFKGAIPYKMMTENLHVHKSLPNQNKKDPENLEELRAKVQLLESQKGGQVVEGEYKDVSEEETKG